MTRIKSATACILAALLALSAATDAEAGRRGRKYRGSGVDSTEVRDLDSFDRISNSGACDIFITFGDKQEVKVTYDEELIDLVKTRVRRNTLKIDTHGSHEMDYSCTIEIVLPKLTEISNSGAGDIIITDLVADEFELEHSGAGDYEITGEVGEFIVDFSGVGGVDARDFKARLADVRLSGVGDIEVYATEEFDGNASGIGKIYYYGDPEKVSRSSSGFAKIRKR